MLKKIVTVILFLISIIAYSQPYTRSQQATNITSNIYANGKQQVTGPVVQGVMLNQNNTYVVRISDTAYLQVFDTITTFYPGQRLVHGVDSIYRDIVQHTGRWNLAHFSFVQIIGGGGGGSDSAVMAGYGAKKAISGTVITISVDTGKIATNFSVHDTSKNYVQLKDSEHVFATPNQVFQNYPNFGDTAKGTIWTKKYSSLFGLHDSLLNYNQTKDSNTKGHGITPYYLTQNAWLVGGNSPSSTLIGGTKSNQSIEFIADGSLVAEINISNNAACWGQGTNTNGTQNFSAGINALGSANSSSIGDVGIGSNPGFSMSSGAYDVLIGMEPAYHIGTGSYDNATGYTTLVNVTSGSYLTFYGEGGGLGITTATHSGGFCDSGGVKGNYNNAWVIGWLTPFLGNNTTNASDSLNTLYKVTGNLQIAQPYSGGSQTGNAALCIPLQTSSATSGTVTSNGAQMLELKSSGTGESLTIALPTPMAGTAQIFEITTSNSNSITLTYSGGTVNGGVPTSVTNTTPIAMYYDGTQWMYKR